MKQLPFNIAITTILLGAVLFVADQGLAKANNSTAPMPGIMIDGFDGVHLKLHGFGFRPGALINVELRQRQGGHVLTGVDVWVDGHGTFAADFDISQLRLEAASADYGTPVNWDDWMVFTTGTSGSFSAPVRVGRHAQQ